MTNVKQTIPWWARFLKQFYLMRTKLIVSFLAVLLIPSILIGYFSYQSAETQLRQQMASSVNTNLNLIQGNINQYVSPIMKDMDVFASEFQSDSFITNADTIQARLDLITKAHPELDGVILGNAKGEYIRSPKKNPQTMIPDKKLGTSWLQHRTVK